MITAHDIQEHIVFRIFISQVYVKVTDQYDFLVIKILISKDMFHFVRKVFN